MDELKKLLENAGIDWPEEVPGDMPRWDDDSDEYVGDDDLEESAEDDPAVVEWNDDPLTVVQEINSILADHGLRIEDVSDPNNSWHAFVIRDEGKTAPTTGGAVNYLQHAPDRSGQNIDKKA